MEFKDPDAYVFDKDGNHVDNGKGGFKTMKEEFSGKSEWVITS